ncbi:MULTISPECIES: hypothetical protein [Streptomyces]|uniref:hypothetical protein n=1 Tax=Streptomyces TaxID=1883 RepID=UPI003870D244
MTTDFFGGREALRNVDVAISAVAGPGEQHRRNHDVIDISDIDVFLGLDVGKGEHHATAITSAGKKSRFDAEHEDARPAVLGIRQLVAVRRRAFGPRVVGAWRRHTRGAVPLDVGCADLGSRTNVERASDNSRGDCASLQEVG